MSGGEGVVADAAVRAAWDSYRVLDDSTTPEERRLARRRIEAAVAVHGRDEVYRGAAFLVGVLATVLAEDTADGSDPLGSLVPAVLRRLRAFEALDAAHVPMVAGALTAAVLGQDVVAWRDRLGSIPPQEAAALGFTLWLLADLHDFAVERPGATDALVRRAFAAMEFDEV